MLPVGGLMAYTVAEDEKGRAAGWFQAGNLGGTGLGGGAGIGLAAHFSFQVSGIALGLAMVASAAAIYFVSDVRPISNDRISDRMRVLGRDLIAMFCSAIPLFTIVLVCSPVGSGAMNNLWSSVAPDWHAGPDTVALVTGVLNGVVSAVGCVIGGWAADRVGRWWTYFGSGTLIALITIVMGLAPKTTFAFDSGVLAYALLGGVAYAAFSAIVLFAIGRGAASTKYATLSSLGNIPVIYMTAIDGWAHDRFGTAGMLYVESFAGLLFIFLALWVLGKIPNRETPVHSLS